MCEKISKLKLNATLFLFALVSVLMLSISISRAYAAEQIELTFDFSGGNAVQISWNAVDGADSYIVYCALTSDDVPALVISTSETQFTQAELQYGETRCYMVVAMCGENELASSTLQDITLLPDTPSIISATSGSYNEINVTWNKYENITDYVLYRSTVNDYTSMQKIASLDSKTTEFTDSNVLPNTQYYYALRTYIKTDKANVYSEYSEIYKADKALINMPEIISAKCTGSRSIKLIWSDDITPDGYLVYRSDTPESGWKRIATIIGGTLKTYTDTSAVPKNKYYYTVKSYIKIDGTNYYSKYVTTGVEGISYVSVPKIKSAVSASTASVKIKWSKLSCVDGYYIYRSLNNNGNWSRIATIKDPTAVSYIDSKAHFNTQYYYTIRAYLQIDGKTYMSDYVRTGVGCKAALVMPKITSISVVGCTSLKIKWSKSTGAEGYYIFRSTKSTGNWTRIATVKGDAVTSYTDKTATCNKQYYYTVRSYINMNDTLYKSAYVTPGAPGKAVPIQPEFTLKSVDYNRIKISWKKIDKADGYVIFRTLKSDSTGWERIKNITGSDVTSYTDKNLKCGQKYYYTVRSYKKVGSSTVYSTYAKGGKPCTPMILEPKVTAGQNANKSVVVTWTKVQGTDTYTVYRRTKGGSWSKIKTLGSSKFYYIDNPPSMSVMYEYTVRAWCGSYASTYTAITMTKYLSTCTYDIDSVLAQAKKDLGKNGIQMGYSEDWCAHYVSRLLKGAGIRISDKACPDDIVVDMVNANLGTYYSFRSQNVTSIQSRLTSNGKKNIISTTRDSFKPQKGDIIIFLWKKDQNVYNWSHVGIVTDYIGSYVYSIEGNTYDNITSFEDDDYDVRIVGDWKRPYNSSNSEVVGILRMK